MAISSQSFKGAATRRPKRSSGRSSSLSTRRARRSKRSERASRNGHRFQGMLESRHPQVRFDWKEIRQGIEANMATLPDLYDYRTTASRGRFHEDLARFTKQLILTDPQHLISSAELLSEHRQELEYLRELIDWRLKAPAKEPNQWNGDNAFYWRFAARDTRVPPDIEEQAAGYYERGEYARAKAAFKLLTDTFEDYAEGHNYLGLIAVERGAGRGRHPALREDHGGWASALPEADLERALVERSFHPSIYEGPSKPGVGVEPGRALRGCACSLRPSHSGVPG